MESKGLRNILKKLNIIQKELKAPKNQYNEFGKFHYRSCEDILEGLKPLCAEHKCVIFLSDNIKMIGDRIYVEATATIFDTESEESFTSVAYAREEDKKDKMDRSQTTGSASSYARKYALNGLLAIDDTKDADSLEPDKPAPKPTPKATPKPPMNSTQYAIEKKEDKPITEAQRKRLFAIGNEADIRAVMKEYEIEHTADIKMSQYDAICKKVEDMKNGAK